MYSSHKSVSYTSDIKYFFGMEQYNSFKNKMLERVNFTFFSQ